MQRSGIGPYLCISLENDLRPLSANNHMFKFADDTKSLVPKQTDVSLHDEFVNVIDWALGETKWLLSFPKLNRSFFVDHIQQSFPFYQPLKISRLFTKLSYLE